MKNKELIKILEALSPEEEIIFKIYNDAPTQQVFSKASVEDPNILNNIEIQTIEIQKLYDDDDSDGKDDSLYAKIILGWFGSFGNIQFLCDEFNKHYKRKEQNE